MTTCIHPIARRVARGFLATSFSAAVLILANACSDDSTRITAPAGITGRARLELVGVSSTNQVYRLRDATFVITARTTGAVVVVSTEADPQQSVLQVELVPDVYEVYLRPGYSLELVDAGRPIADAELVSTNPGTVTVAADASSALAFVFRVGGGMLETGPGLLDIGLEVTEGEVECVPDGFEPNDDAATATPISAGTPVNATLCASDGHDFDVYTFAAPVVEADGFSVRLDFDPSHGALSGELYDADAGWLLAQALPTPSGAIINSLSSARNFRLELSVASGSSFAYTLDIGERSDDGCVPDAFEPNDDLATAAAISAGVPVLANLCHVDQPDDEYAFDTDHYTFAAPVFDGPGFTVRLTSTGFVQAELRSLPSNQTLAVARYHDRNAATIDVVSSADRFDLMMYGQYTPYSIEIGECEACKNDRAVSDCCNGSDAPGCTDDRVHACVCETDISCCTGSFDESCVISAVADCEAECPLPPPTSDCCSASSAPGCSVPEVRACVCDIDQYCCSVGFDDNCAELAQGSCGAACLE